MQNQTCYFNISSTSIWHCFNPIFFTGWKVVDLAGDLYPIEFKPGTAAGLPPYITPKVQWSTPSLKKTLYYVAPCKLENMSLLSSLVVVCTCHSLMARPQDRPLKARVCNMWQSKKYLSCLLHSIADLLVYPQLTPGLRYLALISEAVPFIFTSSLEFLAAVFLGDQRKSYNQYLTIKISFDSIRGVMNSYQDLILRSGQQQISVPLTTQGNPVPVVNKVLTYRFRLNENNRYRWEPPTLTNYEMHAILSNITAIKLRATYAPKCKFENLSLWIHSLRISIFDRKYFYGM